MTNSAAQPQNALEQALAAFEDSVDTRRATLAALLKSKVYIAVDQPWDGRTRPNPGMRVMLVSDDANHAQPMLAIFTDQARSEVFRGADNPFKYVVEVDAPWAMLGAPAGAGIMINPNSTPGFRITPELALELRRIAEEDMARRMAKRQAPAV